MGTVAPRGSHHEATASIAKRRTVLARVLARDRATIRWVAIGGFGDRVGCIPPVRPLSQGCPGCPRAKEMAAAATAEAVTALIKRRVLFSE
jgi:hypothetical protein